MNRAEFVQRAAIAYWIDHKREERDERSPWERATHLADAMPPDLAGDERQRVLDEVWQRLAVEPGDSHIRAMQIVKAMMGGRDGRA